MLPTPCWISLGPSLRWMISGGSTENDLSRPNEMNDGKAVSTAVWYAVQGFKRSESACDAPDEERA